MNKKLALLLAAGALVAGALQANAVPITGGVSFAGGYRAYSDAAGTLVTTDLNSADVIRFGIDAGTTATTVADANGSFGGLIGASATFASPLDINPVVNPAPTPIWTIGGFSLLLTSLTTTLALDDELTLRGSGVISAAGFDDTTGTWIATFNTAGTTFSWSSSSGTQVPDGGATAMLLGVGVLGLAGLRRKLS